MKKLAIILHQKVEEIEAVTTIDLIRRAGLTIDLFSATDQLEIVGSHQIHLQAEKTIDQLKVEDYDGIVFPGGPAVDELLKMDNIVNFATTFNQGQKLVAAICAAPQILGKVGLLKGKKVTHFPSSNQFMDEAIEQLDQEVIIEGNLITSAGAGTAVAFGLTIIEYLIDAQKKEEIKKQIIYHY